MPAFRKKPRAEQIGKTKQNILTQMRWYTYGAVRSGPGLPGPVAVFCRLRTTSGSFMSEGLVRVLTKLLI